MESMDHFVSEVGMTPEELCILMDAPKEKIAQGLFVSEIDIMRINESIGAKMEGYPFV